VALGVTGMLVALLLALAFHEHHHHDDHGVASCVLLDSVSAGVTADIPVAAPLPEDPASTELAAPASRPEDATRPTSPPIRAPPSA